MKPKDNLSYLERPSISGEITFLGVPLDLGKEHNGTDKGPNVFRELGFLNVLKDVGLKVNDLGDIACPSKKDLSIGDRQVKYLEPLIGAVEKVAKQVEGEINNKRKLVVIGGDNTVSIGTIAGASAALDKDIGMIWIDAHGDINTHETTLSGNIHGMPVSAAIGIGHPRLADFYFKGAKVLPKNILYLGLKDLDQAEIDLIRKYNIPNVTMLDILENGLKPVFQKINELLKNTKNIWVCFDIDSVDKEFAPGTPMATEGGFTRREILGIAKYIGKNCLVVGMDVTEFAPKFDVENKTANLISEAIVNFLGSESNWYTRYMEQAALGNRTALRPETRHML